MLVPLNEQLGNFKRLGRRLVRGPQFAFVFLTLFLVLVPSIACMISV